MGQASKAVFLWSPGDVTMGTVIKMVLWIPLDSEWPH